MSEACMKSDEQSQLAARLEACEACGTEFGCGANLAGCWCSEVKLADDALANLRERYGHCLCRACLEKIAESEKEN